IFDPGPHDRGLPTIGDYNDDACFLSTADLASAAKRKDDPFAQTFADGWPGKTWILPSALGDEWRRDEDGKPLADPFYEYREAPWAGSLTPVGIPFSDLTVTPELIDQAATVPNLRGISLADANANVQLLPRLAKLTQLEHLDLSGIWLTDDGLETLAP